MLERLVEQQKAIKCYFADEKDVNISDLTPDEWQFIHWLIDVLQSAEAAATTLSGDQYCTMSVMIPLLSAMIVELKTIIPQS